MRFCKVSALLMMMIFCVHVWISWYIQIKITYNLCRSDPIHLHIFFCVVTCYYSKHVVFSISFRRSENPGIANFEVKVGGSRKSLVTVNTFLTYYHLRNDKQRPISNNHIRSFDHCIVCNTYIYTDWYCHPINHYF